MTREPTQAAGGSRFPKSHRLTRAREFEAVYKNGVVKRTAMIRVHGLVNDLSHSRFGLSVSRRVGSAVKRNRIKRLLRESFRLLPSEIPTGYDLVVVVIPHEPATLADYSKALAGAIRSIDETWRKRGT